MPVFRKVCINTKVAFSISKENMSGLLWPLCLLLNERSPFSVPKQSGQGKLLQIILYCRENHLRLTSLNQHGIILQQFSDKGRYNQGATTLLAYITQIMAEERWTQCRKSQMRAPSSKRRGSADFSVVFQVTKASSVKTIFIQEW